MNPETKLIKSRVGLLNLTNNSIIRTEMNRNLLFRSNLANYLEVITAQENALQAELNLASIQRQQLSAIVELYRSLGGGWK